jgi:hypothetical protein
LRKFKKKKQMLETLEINDMGNLSYNIDLSLPELQQRNKIIASGIKAATVMATVGVAVKAVGGVKAIIGAVKTAATGKTAAGAASVINLADTATDIGSMISNQKAITQIKSTSEGVNKTASTVNQIDQQMGEHIPLVSQEKKGLVESLAGAVTERVYAKPQRQKMINDYIALNLQPDFRQRIEQISQSIINDVQTKLLEESQ